MFEWVVLVLVISLLLYVLLGGADFGAGILELFSPKEKFDELKATTYQAIGPVWEANHVWLIIIIVILFNGFPSAFKVISIYLHIPLLLMLVGIIVRGTAFVFRHYDAVQGSSQKVYSRMFAWSSLITPFFLGVIAGAIVLGRLPVEVDNFHQAFVAPWLNWFTVAVGIFTSSLFAFLAATFLIPEIEDRSTKELFRKNALLTNILVVVTGGLVFVAGLVEKIDFPRLFFSHPFGLVSVILATVGLLVLAVTLRKKWDQLSRLLAGLQGSLIVLGWLALQYPNLIVFIDGTVITLEAAAAPEVVISILGTMLAVGVVLILPALAYLIWVFKYRKGLR
ncbi:MAG: cytochrome d ubiquinol oxidase subunit II [Imperialibacter sp.]|uniref:cytochrome d ubiquinol oxidase subunit II n=1 Tax=Imperialibacter sp. TaxID=2038411 RepID=UPI0032EF3960